MSQNLDDYRTKHLFLLIGSNPLPNLVAARLLAKPNATVWLLHSDGADGEPSTGQAAVWLRNVLLRKRLDLNEDDVKLEPMPSADDLEIYNRIHNLVRNLEGDVGLNYTGGTKPMSVHTYRTMEKELADRIPKPVFSYLDPRKLALRIDRQGAKRGETFYILKEAALRQEVETTLDELAALHGYEPAQSEEWAEAEKTPGLRELCAAIAKVHSQSEGMTQWRKWMNQVKFMALPDVDLYPELGPFCDRLDSLLGGTEAEKPGKMAALLRPNDRVPTLVNCSKWFIGGWLEEHCLAYIRDLAPEFGIKSCGRGLNYQPSDDKESSGKVHRQKDNTLNLDAAAMIGYQLFAISCCATTSKERAKEHLFEIYVRARQLGGDEARIGLVCCFDDPPLLQKEIARQWDVQGKLRVFGRDDLVDLRTAFAEWFATANP